MGIFNESYSSMEIADILGVHRVTVTNWIRKGALGAMQTPGGRYKVSKEDLARFLKSHGLTGPRSLGINDKKLVVAVDGDRGNLNRLAEVFGKGEMSDFYELKTYRDPVDAALFIGDAKPHAVLLDLSLPFLGIIGLAERIKDVTPLTRIIAMAEHATKGDVARLKQRGVDAVLIRPFERDALKALIDEVVGTTPGNRVEDIPREDAHSRSWS